MREADGEVRVAESVLGADSPCRVDREELEQEVSEPPILVHRNPRPLPPDARRCVFNPEHALEEHHPERPHVARLLARQS